MGKGRRHNSRAGRPRRTLDTPEVQALVKERDALKWLLILAMKELPGHKFKITPAELTTRLASNLFEVGMAALPEGGAEVVVHHKTEMQTISNDESEEWGDNRAAVRTEEGEVIVGEFGETGTGGV